MKRFLSILFVLSVRANRLVLVIGALVILGLAGCMPSSGPNYSLPPDVDPHLGGTSIQAHFAIDDSHVYVTDTMWLSSTSRVQVRDLADGSFDHWWTMEEGVGACGGIAIAPDHSIYVAVRLSGSITELHRFSADGKLLSRFQLPGSSVSSPQAVACNSRGEIYVYIERFGLYRYSSTGQEINSWTLPDLNNSTHEIPGIAVDHQDNVYVADIFNKCVYVYDAGDHQKAILHPITPEDSPADLVRGVCITTNDVVCILISPGWGEEGFPDNPRIEKYSTDGEFLGEWSLLQRYASPSTDNITAHGEYVYTWNDANADVFKWDQSGTLIWESE